MKKYSIFIATTIVLLYGCNEQKSASKTSEVTTTNNAATPAINTPEGASGTDAGVELNAYLDRLQYPIQYLMTKGTGTEVVKGKNGIAVRVVPDDLEAMDGTPVKGPIDVGLIELLKQGDFVRNNAPTTSDGKLLVSGGSCYVSCTAGGKQLRLRKGKTMGLGFPTGKDKSMSLFYGERDKTGAVNWKPTNRSVEQSIMEDTIYVRVPRYTQRDTVISDAELAKGSASIFDKLPKKHRATDIVVKNGQTTVVSKVRVWTDTQYVMQRVSGRKNSEQMVYALINANSLGWINCDRFYDVKEKETLAVTMPDADKSNYVKAYIIYTDINSVASHVLYFNQSQKEFPLRDQPANTKARLVAFCWKKGALNASMQDVTLGKDKAVTLRMAPVSSADISRMLNVNGKG